ncbi:MAG: c-type cytochrome biogenesis protein CcmI, partial [Geminicoccaceae bacterium]|nr:c-type cytochrome biogenesis protein CcmI [Geminicoccaceae bacterium]
HLAAPRAAYELEVYKAQLAELERETERNLIGPDEAKSARLEIQRRMLQADMRNRRAPAEAAGRLGTIGSVVGALALITVGVALYGWLGRPDLPDQPIALREAERRTVAQGGPEGQQNVPSVAEMVGRLQQRVEEDPGDLDAWVRLGRAYEMTGDVAQAADAYRQAIEIDDELAPLHAAFAETSIAAAGGVVTEAARAALDRALELDPSEPRARFYDGLALLQRGDRQAALDAWVGLARDSPADAPWLPVLEQRIGVLAGELDLDVAALLPDRPTAAARPAPPLPPGPVAAEPAPLPSDPAALEDEALALTAALERSPRDWQGWIRLARLRDAQGESEAARAALERGAALYQGAPFVLQQFQAAVVDLGVGAPPATETGGRRGPTADQMRQAAEMSPQEQQEMIRGMVEGLAARLEAEPDDLEGWLMLGRSWRVLGETAKSVAAFERALALLPEGAPERRQLEATIESLRGEG